ncbi:hypothetical protein BS17DRAFT_786155 [Gyrodon lividus]|nr:hypothetical protein BS17DRAFT_786155 [Gyrodon lividus]
MGHISEDQGSVEQHAFTGTRNASSLTALIPSDNAATCRYYQAGHCRRGSTCPFAHLSKPGQAEGHPMYQGEQIYAYAPPPEQTPVYRPPNSQIHSLFIWQPYPQPFLPSFDPRYGIAQPSSTPTDYPDDTSDPSSSESSSGFDREVRMALDAMRLRGGDSATVQGMIGPRGGHGVVQSLGFTSYAAHPGLEVQDFAARGRAASWGQYFDHRLAAVYPPPIFLSWKDDPRKKPLAYKKKLCRFYAANGKCTSGDKCTFIHDPKPSRASEESPPESDRQTVAKLPAKPVNKYDDCKARDFYPVTWRVIGGGVMMGGERKICSAFVEGHCKYGDDCKLAHETELGADPDGFMEPTIGSVGESQKMPYEPTRGRTLQKIPRSNRPHKRKSVKARSPEANRLLDAPPTGHDMRAPNVTSLGETARAPNKSGEKEVASPRSPALISLPHRRTRSMSMLTPPHVTPCHYASDL